MMPHRSHPTNRKGQREVLTQALTLAGLNPLDPNSLLASLGALGVFLVLFAETGLLIGFFLPGDSLLFIAGLLSPTTATSTVHLPRLQQAVKRAQHALDTYGAGKAIVLARFIPFVRTVLNPLAGTVGVPARTFTLWQVLGGLVWSLGVTLAGYGLGTRIPNIDHYLLPIIALIVALSLTPVLLELRRARTSRT